MPPYNSQLYDAEGNPVGEAPTDPEQLRAAITSGKFGFTEGTRLNWKTPQGKIVSVPADPRGVLEAIDAGFELETSAGREERKLQEDYGGTGQQILTGARGALRGLSFGISEQALAGIFGDDYVEMANKQDAANPDTAMVSEIGAVLGSFLMPGGQGAAATKLGKLGLKTGKGIKSGGAVRSVAKLGRNIENTVFKAMGGSKGGLVRRSLAKGASLGTGAGVEGAIYGAGQFLSEEALGRTDATAENLLGHMGMGAMWGGVAGAGMGAGGEIIKTGLGAGANFARRSGKSIKNMYEKATGRKAIDGLEIEIEGAINGAEEAIESTIKTEVKPTFVDELGAKLTGTDPKSIATLKNPKAMQEALEADELLNKKGGYVDETAKKMDEFRATARELQEEGMGVRKYKHVKELLDESDRIAVNQTNIGEKGILVKYKDSLDGALMSGKERFGSRGAIEEVRTMTNKSYDDIMFVLKNQDPEKAVIMQFEEMDRLKRFIDNRIKRLSNMRNKNYADDTTIRLLTDQADEIRHSLMNEKLYGKTAAGFQREVNAAWVKRLRKPEMARKFEEEYAYEAFNKVRVTDRKNLKGAFRDYGMPENVYKEEFLKEWAQNEIGVIKAMDNASFFSPTQKSKLARLEVLQKEIDTIMSKAEKTIGLKNQLADIVTRSNQLKAIMGPMAGAGLGYALGGTEGAAIGIGMSVMTNPGRMLHMKAAINKISSNSELGIIKAIKGYMKKATGKVKKVPKGAKGVIAPASLKILGDSNWGEKKTKDKNKYEAFRRRTDEITEFLSNPEKAVERISRNTDEIADVAPKIASAMKVKAIQSARYLYDKMPKSLSSNPEMIKKFKPSDIELAKFERIAAVVDNPMNALESLGDGTVTVEEGDALREMWPETYNKVVEMLAENVEELQEKLPYKGRVNLSLVFPEVIVEETMNPEFLTAMQSINMIPPMQPGQTPGPKQPKSKVGNFSDISVDSASMTSTQKVEMNKLS